MFNDPTNKDGIYTEISFVHLSRFVVYFSFMVFKFHVWGSQTAQVEMLK